MHRYVKQTALLASIILLASAFAACDRTSGGGTDKGDTSVAASVNGKKIMLSEVERIIGQQTQGQQQMSPLQLAAARLQVLDNLVQREVLYQRAEKESLLPKDDELDSAINSQKTNLTQEEWGKFLEANKLTEQGVRDEARKALAIKKLQEKTLGKITISDKQVEDFYNGNKEQFVNARGVGLSAIITDARDNGLQDDAKSEEEAKLKIDRLYSQLKTGGADFASVARASSEDTTNMRGGDLGFATEDDLKQNGFPQELIANFFGAMQPGSFTPPVRFNNGRWYIFKLTNRNMQNENLTLESPGVRDRIKEALRSQQQELLNAALVATAMNEAKIENYLAQNMLNDPNSLNALRPVAAGAPGTTASPAGSPATGNAASPAATTAANANLSNANQATTNANAASSPKK